MVRCPPQEIPGSNLLVPGIFQGQVIPVTQKWALQWLPCQAPGVIGSVLGLVGLVSVYCDWVRKKATNKQTTALSLIPVLWQWNVNCLLCPLLFPSEDQLWVGVDYLDDQFEKKNCKSCLWSCVAVFSAFNKAWCVHHFACSICDRKMSQKWVSLWYWWLCHE